MNASSTHDTKRSEDVRARILVLSEMPNVWIEAADRWSRMTDSLRPTIEGRQYPEVAEQQLIFQTLLGVWPLDASKEAGVPERMRTFLQKAAREAKHHSSWRDPNERYEQALKDYTDAILGDSAFLADFRELQREIAWYGALNSLSQLTLKLGVPGVPDFYQGNEVWTFDLVDPDNRRGVAYDALALRLAGMPAEPVQSAAAEMLDQWQDGRIKMHVTVQGMHARRRHADLFTHGAYIPVTRHGKFSRNVIAFARRHRDQWALVVCGRFYSQVGPMPVGSAWSGTALDLPDGAPAAWRNLFTAEVSDGTQLEAILATLPFAILLPA